MHGSWVAAGQAVREVAKGHHGLPFVEIKVGILGDVEGGDDLAGVEVDAEVVGSHRARQQRVTEFDRHRIHEGLRGRAVAEACLLNPGWKNARGDVAERCGWIQPQQLLHDTCTRCLGQCDLVFAEQARDTRNALKAEARRQDAGFAVGAAVDVGADHDVAMELVVGGALAHGDRCSGCDAGMLRAGLGFGNWICS